MRHLTNVFRRLYRIFAHAWFQHRDVFWQVEGHDGLYMFFKTVCDMYNLIPSDNYTIPPEAEGDEAHQPHQVQDHGDPRRLTILRKDNEPLLPPLDQVELATISTGATTRRHKSSPSIGSRVTTINESAEDSEEPEPLPSPEVKEPAPEPTEAASDTTSELVQSPQSTESQVTVAEVELEDETPSTAEAPAIEEPKDKQESKPAEPVEGEAPATASEEAKPEPAASAEPETTQTTETEPESTKPEPEKKPEQKETTEEPARET
jgi:hypothetical protein